MDGSKRHERQVRDFNFEIWEILEIGYSLIGGMVLYGHVPCFFPSIQRLIVTTCTI